MSLEQVNQVIGCKFNPESTVRTRDLTMYNWELISSASERIIGVFFNDSNLTVTGSLGDGFKYSGGF